MTERSVAARGKHGQRSVVIGFGRAGRELHLPALRSVFGEEQMARTVVFDPASSSQADPVRGRGPVAVASFDDIDFVDAVVHVCTPPGTHADVILAACSKGARHLLVEKPMVTTKVDLGRVQQGLAQARGEVIVVNNWTWSALTAQLRQLVERHRALNDPPTLVSARSLKARLERSALDDGHRTVFDVEIPHLVALVMALFGIASELLSADATDSLVGGRYQRAMGTANIVAQIVDGPAIHFHSDLTSPIAERSIRIEFSGGTAAVGFFPVGSADCFSQLLTFNPAGRLIDQCYLADATLERLLAQSYAFFRGEQPRPVSDLSFNSAVCNFISDAKRLAGVETVETSSSVRGSFRPVSDRPSREDSPRHGSSNGSRANAGERPFLPSAAEPARTR